MGEASWFDPKGGRSLDPEGNFVWAGNSPRPPGVRDGEFARFLRQMAHQPIGMPVAHREATLSHRQRGLI